MSAYRKRPLSDHSHRIRYFLHSYSLFLVYGQSAEQLKKLPAFVEPSSSCVGSLSLSFSPSPSVSSTTSLFIRLLLKKLVYIKLMIFCERYTYSGCRARAPAKDGKSAEKERTIHTRGRCNVQRRRLLHNRKRDYRAE